MDEIIVSLADAPVLLILDAVCEYWQAGVVQTDGGETAFKSYRRLYRFVWVFSEVENTPEMFQRAVGFLLCLTK